MAVGLEGLSGTFAAICALAFTLGLKHGLDADHLATIDGLARGNAVRHPGLARFAGTLFSLGHGIVVIAVAIAASILTHQWATPEWLEVSGATVSVAFLLGLAFLNLHAVWVTPAHLVVAPTGLKSRLFRRLVATERPIFIVGVGMLFALSFDTVSQAALFAVAATRFGGIVQASMLACCFVAGMLVTDGLNSLWIARLIGRADRRAAIASRVMATMVGFASLGIGTLTLFRLILPSLDMWTEERGLFVGIAVIVAMACAFGIAMFVARGHEDQLERGTAQ